MPSPGYRTIECETAADLWEILSPKNELWTGSGKYIYRGQGDASWGLVPSVLREKSIVRSFIPPGLLKTDMELFAEMRLLQVFVEQCDSMGLRIPGDSIKVRRRLDTNTPEGDFFLKYPSRWPFADMIDLMALAQHHKIHTRLLDWTKRSFVAAYFAASEVLRWETDRRDKTNLAIWALDSSRFQDKQPDDALPRGGLYPHISLVHAPGATSPNLAAQAGLFTLLKERGPAKGPVESRALEDEFISAPDSPLIKITLKAIHAPSVLLLCNEYWINAATLYPGYDGAGLAVFEAIKTWPSMPP